MFNHGFAFDPNYGHALPDLLRVGSPDPPADFDAFWHDTFQEAMTVDPAVTTRDVTPPGLDHLEVMEIEFTGLGGFRVGGWVTRPRGTTPRRAVVVGHGYDGRGAPEATIPGPPAVAIFPCARGFHRSARPDLPSEAGGHVVHGIHTRETYLNRFCVADLWSAASAVLSLHPQFTGRLDYMGASFGGGLGALMLPWDHRFRRAYLEVPTFGNHPLRVTLPCHGSGAAVTQLHAKQPGILDVLSYFDAATAARSVRIPVMVGAAQFDPAVPPPGQFAVYNALGGQRQLLVMQAGHFDHAQSAGEAAMTANTVSAWFWQA